VKAQSRGEELHWAKQVKEQQRVVDRNDNPRERQYLDCLKARLEIARAERKATSASQDEKAQEKEKEKEKEHVGTHKGGVC